MEKPIEILLVEDTPSDIRLTQEALKRSSLRYDLKVVNDGVEAMEYLKSAVSSGGALPDIILLDLNMPRKNGHEVMAEIQADASLKPIPVIVLTVSQRDEDVMEALKLKMNYYLAKPVTAQKLSSLVDAIHSLHHDTALKESKTGDDMHIRLVLAGNPHTSPMVLAKLAEDPSERIRSRVAANPEIPHNLLVKLAKDSSPEVRLSVSENQNAPTDLLELLARDPSDDVRLGLAENPHLPPTILRALTEDENTFVSASAKRTMEHV